MKILKSEVAFATPWFEIVGKTLHQGEAPYYSLRLPDYAAILAITAEKRILAVRQYRPAIERVTIEFPSGLIDPGESPAEAAERELREETGYQSAGMQVLTPMLPDTGRLANRIWGCIAPDVRPLPEQEPEEGIEVITYSAAELDQAIDQGTFDHALHVAVWAVARRRLPL